MSAAAGRVSAEAAAVVLGGRYRLFVDKPLPRFDSPHASAITATDERAPGRPLFALICRPDLQPRLDIIAAFSRMLRLPILSPVEAGVVDWPEGGRRVGIVFEHGVGERVLAAPDARIAPMHEDQVIRRVVKPLIPVLKELSARHMTHRAIRADNLFYQDSSRESVVLGECVSAPPAFGQPVIYEPIDSAMCRPAGRGTGTAADDLYAFGVLLMVMLNGGDPCAGLSEEEIVDSKINRGSYATMLGEARLTINLMEPLRGLLVDDAKERWTVAELEQWAAGRQMSPKQPMLTPRAARSIEFAGREYWNPLALAHAMGRKWREAARMISEGTLEIWLRRSLSDDETADTLRTIAASGTGGGDQAANMVSRALIALSPEYPLRYCEFAARIDAVPQALAIEFNDPSARKTAIDMLRAKIPQAYLQSTKISRANQAALMKTFDMFSHFLERPYLGGGIERALYESNRAWPCQSPLLRDQLATEVKAILPGLERAMQTRAQDGEPIDAHIVGFCMARLKPVSERISTALNTPNDLPTFRLGVLQLLAATQRAGAAGRFPTLSRRMVSLLRPVVETYHNRAYRERLAGEVERAGENGDLAELLFLVDSLEARTQDSGGFDRARQEYRDLERNIGWLQGGGLTSREHVLRRSRQAATVISAVASGLAVVAMTVLFVS